MLESAGNRTQQWGRKEDAKLGTALAKMRTLKLDLDVEVLGDTF